MTTIERFQKLQVELVRAGFDTELHAHPDGDKARMAMYVDLRRQTAPDLEKLDGLAGDHGFTYTVGENSRAAITLAADAR